MILSKKALKCLGASQRLSEGMYGVLVGLKKRGYKVDGFRYDKHSDTEWFHLSISSPDSIIGKNSVNADINENYMTMSGEFVCSEEMDLSEGDFTELFFKNLSEYERLLEDVKRPLDVVFKKVCGEFLKRLGMEYTLRTYSDFLVVYIKHREMCKDIFRLHLDRKGVWWIQEVGGTFITDFNEMYGECDMDGEAEFESLKEMISEILRPFDNYGKV